MNKNVNAIRVLAIDMIEKANSGHPGICMGAAPMMYSLFANNMNINRNSDRCSIRDRFVLAAGHGSAMLYSTLHLSGLAVDMEDLKNFRQLGSKTPGHPEVTHTGFIDATSGPLGQGIAQAVGLAMAEKHLAAKYNVDDYQLVDTYTYALCGDGDLQEGVASEASSLAGHFKLNKLIILWDSNDIQLDNPTNVAITEDIKKRYEAYGFNVIVVNDGENVDEIDAAIARAKLSDKPTLIEVKTTIGYGSPNKGGKPDCHGAPLGADEIALAKANYNWDLPAFTIEEDMYAHFANKIDERFAKRKAQKQAAVKYYEANHSQLLAEYNAAKKGEIDYDFDLNLEQLGTSFATRVASGKAINHINDSIPNLIGGSADLSKSNNTTIENSGKYMIDGFDQKNINYGVREFAMAAITNGMMLYGGLKAFNATFFVFSDYLKPAIRMSAIQQLGTIYVLTHDSVAVGEDGPTHQPIEQLSGLRAIPNLNVIRPADYNETQAAWKYAINSSKTPTVLALTRQNIETVSYDNVYENLSKGAYVISDMEDYSKVLIGTGSEVATLIQAQKILAENGVKTRVISMPIMNVFNQQPASYQQAVLGTAGRDNTYFVEMASAHEGYKYAANLINIESFGESGEGNAVMAHFGFTPEKIAQKILNN